MWFHDAIYDPKSSENEEKSAQLFDTFAGEMDLDGKVRDHVRGIIVDTIKHKCSRVDDEEYKRVCEVFLDSDLSILGAEPDLYEEYAGLIW